MPGFCFTQACTAPLLLRIVRAAELIADAGPGPLPGPRQRIAVGAGLDTQGIRIGVGLGRIAAPQQIQGPAAADREDPQGIRLRT